MTTQTATTPAPNTVTPAAWQALPAQRRRNRQDRDLFGDRERAQLRFRRRLYPGGYPVP
jgi:hypothetical protein